MAFKLLSFSDYLRGWIGAIGLISLINACQAVWNPELLSRNVYTGDPQSVTRLASRQFALWTALCGLVRLAFCVNPEVGCLRLLTVATFVLTVAHFLAEVFVWATSQWTFGVISPCFIAVISLLLFTFDALTGDRAADRDDNTVGGGALGGKARLERMMMRAQHGGGAAGVGSSGGGGSRGGDSRKNL